MQMVRREQMLAHLIDLYVNCIQTFYTEYAECNTGCPALASLHNTNREEMRGGSVLEREREREGTERREIEMCKVRQRQMKTKKPVSVNGTATEMPKCIGCQLLASLMDDITAPHRKSISPWPLGNMSIADRLWAATCVVSSLSSSTLTWTPIKYAVALFRQDTMK